MPKLSLSKKIILVISLTSLFIGGIVAIYVFKRSSNFLTNQKKDEIIKLNSEQSYELNEFINGSVIFTKMIASRTRVAEYLTELTEARRIELVDIFNSYQAEYPQYLAIYLLDNKGKTLISTDKRFLNQTYNFRRYFIEAMKGRTYTEAILGVTSNQFGYYFSSPVKFNNKIIGVVVTKLKEEYINNSINRGHAVRESKVMLVDHNGIIFYSQEKDRLFKSLGKLNKTEEENIKKENSFPGININHIQYDIIQDQIRHYSKPTTAEFFDHEDNEKEIIGIARIGQYPYYLISEIGMDRLTNYSYQFTLILALGIFLTSLVSLIITSLIINRFLKPLDLFRSFSEKISQGDFTQRIEIRSKDEFEELANTLNKMTINLKDMYDHLEEKVKEQTVNIQQKISDLEKAKKASLNLLEDINEQKKISEERANDLQKFQLAVENASDHIVITDQDGNCLYANKAAEIITGFSQSEIIGSKAGVKWGKLMGKEFYEKLWNTIKEKKRTFSGEIKNRRKNGEIYIADAQISPIINAQNQVIFFVGIEHDITKAKEVDRMKTEFISLASHQLRTPLSAMKWFLEMLLNGDAGPLNPEQKDYVLNIDQSNNRMIDLVNSLLNVSRIESGRIIIDPKPTELAHLVHNVIDELQNKLNEKKQQVIISIYNQLPLINVDEKLIRQVYMNLLTNAIKYSPKNETITIIVSKRNNEIISQVSDNGYGIPKSEIDKIFDKFYRATNILKKETEGTGLGLYLVKSIIESSGGKIWFTSEENQGTSFYFTLPISGMVAKSGVVTIDS